MRLVDIHRARSPRRRVFCLPHAGGGADAFRSWSALAPDDLDVIAIELPGRGRTGGTPLRRMDEAVTRAHEAIAPLLDLPYALYGHSLGAKLAFELALSVERTSQPAPRHVWLAADLPPFRRPQRPTIFDLDDEAFVAIVCETGGTPRALLDHPAMREYLLTFLRADFELYDTYVPLDAGRLRAPLTVLCGESDAIATPKLMQEWARHTSGEFRSFTLDAGHLFAASHAPWIVERIASALREDSGVYTIACVRDAS